MHVLYNQWLIKSTQYDILSLWLADSTHALILAKTAHRLVRGCEQLNAVMLPVSMICRTYNYFIISWC